MFVPKADKLRHRTLELLIEKIEEDISKDINEEHELSISVSEISRELKISEKDFYRISTVLIAGNEIEFSYGAGGEKQVSSAGGTSKAFFGNNKYLIQGRKQRVDIIKDNLYIIVSAIAIISAISSLIVYISSTKTLQREMDQLRQEVRELKNKG